MKRRRCNFRYFITEGFRNIFLHGFMSFAAMTVIVAFLIIMGSFSLLAVNIDSVVQSAAGEHTITVVVDGALSDEQARGLEFHILAVENVSACEFTHKDQALDDYRAELGAENSLLDGIAEGDNPLRHRYTIFLSDITQMSETRDRLEAIDGVAKANAPIDVESGFLTLRSVIGAVSVAMIALLTTLSLFVISNTVKLATMDRREEIAIMRVVGATNTFIRWPFLIEGFLLGIVASVSAFAIQWWIYGVVTERMGSADGLIAVLPFSDFASTLLGLFLAAGFVVGVGGSTVAIRKFLKI